MLSQTNCNTSGKMSQEQSIILPREGAGKTRAEATDSLIEEGGVNSPNVHNPVLNESDHGDDFTIQKQDECDDVNGVETSSDVIMSASNAISNFDGVDSLAPVDEINTCAVGNDNSDTVGNTNVIVLTVIEKLLDYGKDNCNKDDHDVCLGNKTDHIKTKTEHTIKDVFESPNSNNTSSTQSHDLFESSDSGSCVKDNLMTALELSPVQKHSLELICSNPLQENEKVREAVHFTSPIATVHEYSAGNEALSDDDTDIISPSCSDDCPATQTVYLNKSVQDNDTADISLLLTLDSDEKDKECVHTFDKESEKPSVSSASELCQTVCSDSSEIVNEVACNEEQEPSEQDLSVENKQIIDHDCSSDSQSSVHVLSGAADNVVKAECNENFTHIVAGVSLNCEVTKNYEDQKSEDIPFSSRSEELVDSNPIQSNVVLDEVQNCGTSEADQAAVPTEAKSEYEVLDEISGFNDCSGNLKVEMENLSANNEADFAGFKFDQSTGNEIFQKEILTSTNETDSTHEQIHVESMSNVETEYIEQKTDVEVDKAVKENMFSVQTDSIEQTADVEVNQSVKENMHSVHTDSIEQTAEVEVYVSVKDNMPSVQTDGIEQTPDVVVTLKESMPCDANFEPVLGGEELNTMAEVDSDMVACDGNSARGSISQEKQKVDDFDINCQEVCELNDNVVNGELLECKSDETDLVSITVKRELDDTASPNELSSVKRHKIDHNSGELTHRKRKLTNKVTENTDKVRKMNIDINMSENLSKLQFPKMLKQLSSEKLTSLDEEVVWECQSRNMDTIKAVDADKPEHKCRHDEKEGKAAEHETSNDSTSEKCNTPLQTASENSEEQCDTDIVEIPDVVVLKNEKYCVNDTNKNDLHETGLYDSYANHISEIKNENVVSSCKTNDSTNEDPSNSPPHAASDNFKNLCETVTDDAEVPDVTDLKNKTEIQFVVTDTNEYEVEGPNKAGLHDLEAYTSADQNIDKLIPVDDQIGSSCKFISATEYLSQSSHNSGSQGFVVDASESAADICVSQALNIETIDDVNVQQTSPKEAHGLYELDEPCADIEGKESKTVIMYEIDETDLKEERMVVPSDVAYSDVCDVTKDTGKMTTHDEDEQMDTALLDLYVDKAVDQMVPSYEHNEAKLYVCDVDMCDDQDSSVCKPGSEKGTSQGGQGCFKWKYTPSCDTDIHTPELPDEDQVIRITPLKTCGKPLRLGLSRRQPMKKSLHKIVRH